MNLPKIELLGVHVSAVNPDLAVAAVKDMISQGQKTYVCVAPVSTLVDCQKLYGYKGIVNQAGMVTPDGAPVALLCRLKGAKDVRRTYGPELMANLCREKGLRHFFFGGSLLVLEKLAAKLKENNPDLIIAGFFPPPYTSEAKVESSQIIDMINASEADIVWVALGSPKQDFWMSLNRAALKAPVLIGVGAAFDFISGNKPQAPRWMQQGGLEWLFRLCCEPRRLWRRYLIGNTVFIWLVIKDFFKKSS